MADQLITMLAPQSAGSFPITSLASIFVVAVDTLPFNHTNMPCTELGIATFGLVPVHAGAVAEAIAGGGADASWALTLKVTVWSGSSPSVRAIFEHESALVGSSPSKATE